MTDALGDGSRLVIDQDDQYEVYDTPSASDPSHSMLSKVSSPPLGPRYGLLMII